MAAADPIHVKCVAVGDGAVGKTCLLMTFATNTFPESYVPTIFENYCADCTVDGKKIALTLWDTAGQEDYDRLRPLSYPETDVVLICYSIDSQDSLDNVKSKWWPEIQHYIPGVPIVLVGTKSDLRTDEKAQQRLKAKGVNMVSQKQASQLQKEIGAVVSGECSALTRDNIKHIFEEAVRFSLTKKSNSDKPNKSCCTIL